MNLPPRPILAEALVIVVDRPPRRKIVRQLPPRAACTHDVQHRSDDLTRIDAARPTTGLGRRDPRLDQSPLTVRHVGWVRTPFHLPLSASSGLFKQFLRRKVFNLGGSVNRTLSCSVSFLPKPASTIAPVPIWFLVPFSFLCRVLVRGASRIGTS